MNTTQLISSILSVPVGFYCAAKVLINTLIFPESTLDWILWLFSGFAAGVIAYAVFFIFIAYPVVWLLNKILTSTKTFRDL